MCKIWEFGGIGWEVAEDIFGFFTSAYIKLAWLQVPQRPEGSSESSKIESAF